MSFTLREMKLVVFSLIAVLFCMSFTTAALGISPAKKNIDFSPGAEYTFTYNVYSDTPDRKIEVYAEGDLAEYVSFSRTDLSGGGDVVVTLRLPDSIDTPGPHTLLIGAKELPTEQEFIGVAINIRAVIYVFVPYPGKYAEVELSVPDGNTGDKIPVQVYVINRGKEDITAETSVAFKTLDGQTVETMTFLPLSIPVGHEDYFRKYLDTTNIKAANYIAEATVNYNGDQRVVNQTFRVGSLFVNITNMTTRLQQRGIQKFFVGIESRWNNDLPEVYADVNVSNEAGSTVFRTPSLDLPKWSRKELTGYLDTDVLEGKYLTAVTLHYAGQTTLAHGELYVYKYSPLLVASVIIGIIVIVLMIIAGIVWFIRRSKKKK